ncbi:MAG: transporter, partial [Rhodoglobus sp.]|nr:transporter [Rhodoglobus sp.]
PPGVMLGHSGKWMVGYEYLYERMNGNLDGSSNISESRILESFFASPTDMSMQMHMGTLTYVPSERLSLMAMVPYVVKSMDHVTVDGERFNERTTGFGDVELRAHYTLYERPGSMHHLYFNGGVALPTGSINERLNGMRLEYPMQLGAGTVSVMPGLSYLGQSGDWGWGVDALPTLRFDENRYDYRLGNQYRVNAWAMRRLTESLNLSARADARRVDNISGADDALDREDEPTKDPNLQAGRRLDLLLGLNFQPSGSGATENQRFYLEAGVPAYQSLDGPQLKTEFLGRVNWQWHFN